VSPLEQFAVVVMGLALALISLVVLVVVVLRWGSRRGSGKGLVLETSSPTTPATAAPAVSSSELVGKRGVTVTPLRPAGTALFGDQRIDVVTEATFIPQGASVEVVAVEGKRVIVRLVPSEESPSASS